MYIFLPEKRQVHPLWKMFDTIEELCTNCNLKRKLTCHNVNLSASQSKKNKCFTYLEECVHPESIYQYLMYTDSITHRRTNTNYPRFSPWVLECHPRQGQGRDKTSLEEFLLSTAKT